MPDAKKPHDRPEDVALLELLAQRDLLTRPGNRGAATLPDVPFAQESPLTRFFGELLAEGTGAPTGGEGGGVAGAVGGTLGAMGPGALIKALKGLIKPATTAVKQASLPFAPPQTPKSPLASAAESHTIPEDVVRQVMSSRVPVGPEPTGRQVLPPAGLDPTPKQLREMGAGMAKMLDPSEPFERRLIKAIEGLNKTHPHVLGSMGEIRMEPIAGRPNTAGQFLPYGYEQYPQLAGDLQSRQMPASSIDPEVAERFRKGAIQLNPNKLPTVPDVSRTLAHEATHGVQAARLGPELLPQYFEELKNVGYNNAPLELSARRSGEKAKARATGTPVTRPKPPSADEKLNQLIDKLAAELNIK